MHLQGAHVVVLGGSSGIGLATARAVAEAGGQVTIVGRDRDRLDRARLQLPHGVAAESFDMRAPTEVHRFFSSVGRVDHVVLAASEAATGGFREMPVPTARQFFDSKFWGPYIVAREAASVISGDGSLVFFSGAAAEVASPGFAVGSTINAAIETLVRTLAVELAPVRVNAISPGIIDTPVWNALDGVSRDDVFADVAARVPARRVGTPDEVAAAVLHVLMNRYITGIAVRVDGGYALA